jgi:alpha-galactosidase
MDAAGISYVFGINDQNELQTLYWGKRLSEKDHFGAAKELVGAGSFDPPSNVTPREFVSWAAWCTSSRT